MMVQPIASHLTQASPEVEGPAPEPQMLLAAAKTVSVKVPPPPKLKSVKIKAPKVKAPKVRVSTGHPASKVKVTSTGTSASSSLKTMLQREAVHVGGTVVARSISSAVVQAEKLHANEKAADAKAKAQAAAAQAAAASKGATAPAPNALQNAPAAPSTR